MTFIGWVCPLLKPQLSLQDEFIYQEGDPVMQIYFLDEGAAAFVMLRYNNFNYISIKEGDHFGVMDIAFKVEQEQKSMQSQTAYIDLAHLTSLNRKFTVQAVK